MSLNALHSFFLEIPPIISAITVVTAFSFWLIHFHGVRGMARIDARLQIGLPDLMLTYSPSTLYQKLTRFGEGGRSAYGMFLESAVFVFAVI